MIEKNKEIFKILKMPIKYEINKALLKKNYFDLVKYNHPDINFNENKIDTKNIDINKLNYSYKILNNDFERAKLFCNQNQDEKFILNSNSNNDFDFFKKCIKIEDKIEKIDEFEKLIKIKNYLNDQVEICKKTYNDIRSINRWSFLNRLIQNINKKI